jgi:ubiquinone/menaquinone biosynthesis C-methylase UbiE
MDSDDVELFNRWSRTYENSLLQRLYFDQVHKGVLRVIPLVVSTDPASIVDIGCGTGRLLRKIRQMYPISRLMGVDPAEGMIKEARRLTPDAKFSVGAVESLPFPDGSIDLAISTLSFHHWRDQAEGLLEIKRVLRPEGRFLLADAVHPIFLARLFHHGKVRTAAEIRDIFEQTGLDILEQQWQMLGHILATVGIRREDLSG